ncbi:DUF72 domain-containing protein [Microcoleus sp. FACHB-68]|uniref:DUF72 domain-containing protein n=1 Tax=Microcoleus sp. FACHB-68 TaxID=2692826 RepID=UPI001689FEED|nr:DUF72 domain-containing protein [Microcoleus sp. FACHB-68]MBD1938761.1 DUF72 domain-containing protein [Microcoleus sp. FACHB-68]
MNFFIGCAVWAYKGWVGELYPPASKPKDFLQLYSRRFTTVEGNTTFYAIPDKETVARWKAETPKGFEFCLKLPRDLTHNGLLQSSIPAALKFLEQMQELGNRLGPIFAQLPPSYSPELLDDLTGFLEAWPRNAPLALEVRHADWFKEPHIGKLNAVLQDLGIGRVLLDTRPVYSSPEDAQLHLYRRKPQLPVQPTITAPFSLIRFISHPSRQYNQEFLEEWVSLVDGYLRQGIRVYFFVHCPVDEKSPGTARYFQQLLEQQNAPVPALPWDTIEQTPTQLNLF